MEQHVLDSLVLHSAVVLPDSKVHVITKTNAKCMFCLTKEVSFSTKLLTTTSNT